MINSIIVTASLLCSGNIKTNKGTNHYVNLMLHNITSESLELGLQYGSIKLTHDKRFTYSAPLDEYGSIVEIKLGKRTGNAHYTYLNFGSDGDLKSVGSGWLSCRKT